MCFAGCEAAAEVAQEDRNVVRRACVTERADLSYYAVIWKRGIAVLISTPAVWLARYDVEEKAIELNGGQIVFSVIMPSMQVEALWSPVTTNTMAKNALDLKRTTMLRLYCIYLFSIQRALDLNSAPVLLT